VEPRSNELLCNEVLGITNDILQPNQSYGKMYGTEPRLNESRYNKIHVITNSPEAQTYDISCYSEELSSRKIQKYWIAQQNAKKTQTYWLFLRKIAISKLSI